MQCNPCNVIQHQPVIAPDPEVVGTESPPCELQQKEKISFMSHFPVAKSLLTHKHVSVSLRLTC